MVDFEKLVTKFLVEREEQGMLPGFENKAAEEKISSPATNKHIQDFISDPKELLVLKQKLKEFNIQESDLTSLSPAWYRILDETIFLRFTVSQASKPEYTNLFPYVDFLALMKESKAGEHIKFNKHSIDKALIDEIQQLFSRDFSSRKIGSHPFFGYTPKSRLLKSEHSRVKQHILSSQTIGKMVVANFVKNNFSLKRSVYEVVNMRQDAPKTQVAAENKDINNLLLEPENYVPGGVPPIKTMPIEVRNFAESFIGLSQKIKLLIQADSASKLAPLDYITKKTLKDLQLSSLPEAKDVLSSLTALANVIPKNPTKEWSKLITGALSGATQIAQGARLGAKMMGR